MNRQLKKTLIFSFVLLGFLGIAGNASAKTDVVTVTTCTSATFQGRVSGTKNEPTDVWFEWGTGRRGDENFFNQTPAQTFTSNGNFSETVLDLTPNTNYYYKAIVSNKNGKKTGTTINFKTPSCGVGAQSSSSPITVTLNATNISNTSAQLNAMVVNPEGLYTIVWFEWGTTVNLGNKTKIERVGADFSISYKDTISGLVPGTKYYYAAVAENPGWRKIGSVMSFVASGTSATVAQIKNTTIKSTINTVETKTVPAKDEFSGLAANVLGVGSFFPTTLFGWTFLSVLLLALINLGKYVYRGFEERKHI